MNALITEYMQRDISRLFPLAMLVVLLLLFFLLRSVLGMVAPILVTLFSIVWTFGFKGALGSPLTLVETIIPVMLIAIGCADGVHILSEFQEFRKRGYQSKDAVLETMRLLTVPVIMTSVTTADRFQFAGDVAGNIDSQYGAFSGIRRDGGDGLFALIYPGPDFIQPAPKGSQRRSEIRPGISFDLSQVYGASWNTE